MSFCTETVHLWYCFQRPWGTPAEMYTILLWVRGRFRNLLSGSPGRFIEFLRRARASSARGEACERSAKRIVRGSATRRGDNLTVRLVHLALCAHLFLLHIPTARVPRMVPCAGPSEARLEFALWAAEEIVGNANARGAPPSGRRRAPGGDGWPGGAARLAGGGQRRCVCVRPARSRPPHAGLRTRGMRAAWPRCRPDHATA